MSKVLFRRSIAFLLSGPGIAVLIRGPEGSLGKSGASALDPCGFTAAATLAPGLAVVVTGRTALQENRPRQEKGRSPDVLRSTDAIINLYRLPLP